MKAGSVGRWASDGVILARRRTSVGCGRAGCHRQLASHATGWRGARQPNILAFPAVTYVLPIRSRPSADGASRIRRHAPAGDGALVVPRPARSARAAAHPPRPGPGRRAFRVLDFGCGTGGNSLGYAALGRWWASSPTGSALRFAASRRAAARHRLDYCRGGRHGAAVPERASFDAVIASDVLEHIADDQAAAQRGGPGAPARGRVHFLGAGTPLALERARRGSVAPAAVPPVGAGAPARRRPASRFAGCPTGIRCCSRRSSPGVSWPRGWGTGRLSPIRSFRPRPVNTALTRILLAEAWALGWLRFPFGVSLVGAATPSTH